MPTRGPVSRDLIEFDNQGRAIYFSRETGEPSLQSRGFYPPGAGPTLQQDMPKDMAAAFDQDFPEKKGPLAPTKPPQDDFPMKSHIPAGAIPGSPGTNPDTPSWALPFAGQPPMGFREAGARLAGAGGATATAGMAGPLGAAARIGVGAGAGGIRGGSEGALKQGLISALIEGTLPGIGGLMRILPGIRNALPVHPAQRTFKDQWSHSPWAGTSQQLPGPLGPTPSPILNPAGQPARMIPPPPMPAAQPTHVGPVTHTGTSSTIPARPYMPNLPPMLRALLEAATNMERGQDRSMP